MSTYLMDILNSVQEAIEDLQYNRNMIKKYYKENIVSEIESNSKIYTRQIYENEKDKIINTIITHCKNKARRFTIQEETNINDSGILNSFKKYFSFFT